MLEITVTVRRDKGEAKTYLFAMTTESHKTKEGMTRAIFTPPENPDIEWFSKLYIKPAQDKPKASKKS